MPVRFFFAVLCSATCATLSLAEVRLPAIFGDHMVLQRNGSAPIWGVAEPGEEITVTVGQAHGKATAAADGTWMVKFSGLPASSKPVEVVVQGKNTIVLQDVLVGDVWICSGQSNMNFGVKMDSSAAAEIPKADHPEIRLYMVPQRVSPTPCTDIIRRNGSFPPGQWLVCTPETVIQNGWGGFSAVGYFFGRDLHAFTRQPVGLIETTFSGTPAEAWTSLEALQKVPALKTYADAGVEFRQNYAASLEKYNVAVHHWQADFDQWKKEHDGEWKTYLTQLNAWHQNPVGPAPKHPLPGPSGSPDRLWNTSSVLFNGMVAPLIPYGIKGVVWYQGEGNTTSYQRALDYVTLLPTMITDWRTRWQSGDFPFLIVQLASWNPPVKSSSHGIWPYTREAQIKTLSLPNTGLATAIDIGEPGNLHPTDKSDVGARLALVARNVVYGDNVVSSGPTFSGMKIDGIKVRVTFVNLGQGLEIGTPPGAYHPGEPRAPTNVLRGFMLAGADGKYADATALLDGNSVVVSCDQVPVPVSVRYNWADVGTGNLYNKAGLPALPFRTDTLPPR